MKNSLKYALRILLVVFFLGLSFYFLIYSSPNVLVGFIGTDNAYLLMFILAFFGGLTTFSGIPYHIILITLALGGLNLFLLGFSAAMGVMVGDSTSYFVGYQGSAILPESVKKILQPIRSFAKNYPKTLPVIFFSYGALIPFSNDFIVISMGLSKYPFWKVMLPLGVGTIFFNVMLAFLAKYAYGFLQIIFF